MRPISQAFLTLSTVANIRGLKGGGQGRGGPRRRLSGGLGHFFFFFFLQDMALPGPSLGPSGPGIVDEV